MNRCPTPKRLGRYADGEVAPSDVVRLDEHVAACGRCAQRLKEMRDLDVAIRRLSPAAMEAPDVAGRVTDALQRRGTFFRARVEAGRRRIFGESRVSGRAAMLLAVAAVIVVAATAGLDSLTRERWAARTAPVLTDAERVLVRLVYTVPPDEARVAWARGEARRLALSARLAEAQRGAAPAAAGDLAYLAATFAVLAGDDPLPPAVLAELGQGDALSRTARLREAVEPKG